MIDNIIKRLQELQALMQAELFTKKEEVDTVHIMNYIKSINEDIAYLKELRSNFH